MKVISVSTSMKDEHVNLPKPKSQLTQLHVDDEDVSAASVIDRYAARPLALQNICLAEFAVMYDVIQSSTKTEETEDVNTKEDMQNIENTNPYTKMKLQKDWVSLGRENRRQYYGQEGTKSMQNQTNITMQSFYSITHGIMRMT